MKQLLDYLPVIVFFSLYFLGGRDIYLATWGILIATTFQVTVMKLVWKHVEGMHLTVWIITLIFAGLTLGLRNEIFIMWRPSIISFVLAAVLLVGHFLRGRNLLQRLCEALMRSALGHVITLTPGDWKVLNLAFIGYMMLIGILNLYVAYNFSTDFWVTFKLIGFTAIQILFYLGVFLYIYHRMPEADRKRLFSDDKEEEPVTDQASDEEKKDRDALRDHQ